MKTSILKITIICIYSLIIIGCSSNSEKKDTNAKNIQEETASSNSTNNKIKMNAIISRIFQSPRADVRSCGILILPSSRHTCRHD